MREELGLVLIVCLRPFYLHFHCHSCVFLTLLMEDLPISHWFPFMCTFRLTLVSLFWNLVWSLADGQVFCCIKIFVCRCRIAITLLPWQWVMLQGSSFIRSCGSFRFHDMPIAIKTEILFRPFAVFVPSVFFFVSHVPLVVDKSSFKQSCGSCTIWLSQIQNLVESCGKVFWFVAAINIGR